MSAVQKDGARSGYLFSYERENLLLILSGLQWQPDSTAGRSRTYLSQLWEQRSVLRGDRAMGLTC